MHSNQRISSTPLNCASTISTGDWRAGVAHALYNIEHVSRRHVKMAAAAAAAAAFMWLFIGASTAN